MWGAAAAGRWALARRHDAGARLGEIHLLDPVDAVDGGRLEESSLTHAARETKRNHSHKGRA